MDAFIAFVLSLEQSFISACGNYITVEFSMSQDMGQFLWLEGRQVALPDGTFGVWWCGECETCRGYNPGKPVHCSLYREEVLVEASQKGEIWYKP